MSNALRLAIRLLIVRYLPQIVFLSRIVDTSSVYRMGFPDLLLMSFSFKLFLVIILYFVSRSIYCLTLHPLASFPGPKLAAVTHLYAMFYDLPVHSSYLKRLPELHDKYGVLKVLFQ